MDTNSICDFYGWMLIKEYKGIPPHTVCGLWQYDEFNNAWSSNGSAYPSKVCEKMRETDRSRWRNAEDNLCEREVDNNAIT